jgi:F-type H+-transporting ATPase subunit a
MPKHTYWLTYLLDKFPALKDNAKNLGDSFVNHNHPDYRSTEPILTSMLYMAIIVILALIVRRRVLRLKDAVVPPDGLTLTTFLEVFVAYFYGMVKETAGAANAKRYFPLIGSLALYIFFSNIVGLIPGVSSPTSSWGVTIGCALIVLVVFNYYGIRENGVHYFKHFLGPKWYLAPLMLLIEIFSVILVRPFTLSVRLMVNISVDHLLVAVFLSLVPLLVPIPIMVLGIIVAVVQTLVFCLLTTVYIALATEHHEEEGGAAHAH